MYRALLVLTVSGCALDAAPLPPDAELVGIWRLIPARADTPLDQRELLTFDAEGHYSKRNRRSDQGGSFENVGTDLVISSSTGDRITTGYAVTSDRLIVDAMFPVGETAGLVGTWSGTQSSADATSTIELELLADGTGHVLQTGSLTDDVTATWHDESPFVVVTFDGVTRPRSLPALPDVAIGEWLYERMP